MDLYSLPSICCGIRMYNVYLGPEDWFTRTAGFRIHNGDAFPDFLYRYIFARVGKTARFVRVGNIDAGNALLLASQPPRQALSSTKDIWYTEAFRGSPEKCMILKNTPSVLGYRFSHIPLRA